MRLPEVLLSLFHPSLSSNVQENLVFFFLMSGPQAVTLVHERCVDAKLGLGMMSVFQQTGVVVKKAPTDTKASLRESMELEEKNTNKKE